MRKYRTPNGQVVDESVLRQRYGSKFDSLVSNGTFSLATEKPSAARASYVAPNGKIADEEVLRSKYGDDFDSMVSNGTFKKKDGGVSSPTPASSPSGGAPLSYESLGQLGTKDLVTAAPARQLQRFGELAAVQKKINTGTIKAKDFSDIIEHPEAAPLLDTFVKQYAGEVKEGENEVDVAVKNAQFKNRKNAKAEVYGEIEQRRNRLTDIIDNFQVENLNLAAAKSEFASPNIARTPLSKLVNPNNYDSLIDHIQSATSLVSKDGKTKMDKGELIELINKKMADDISLNPISPEIKSLSTHIQDASVKWNNKSSYNKVATGELLEYDKVAAENFENGLEYIKKTDIGRYKNVVRALKDRSDVPQTDFEMIAAVGQEIKNKRILRESTDNSQLIGKETAVQYMGKSNDSRKARIAGEIGEYLKSRGHTNESAFSEKVIRDAAKALKINDPELVNDLVLEEKLFGYDAIPKSGWIPSVAERGIVAPFTSASKTLDNIFNNESDTETYFRSQDPSGRLKGAQQVPDAAGNMEGKLASDRDNVWYSMLEGAGQMATQVFLTKGIGGAVRSAAGAAVKGVVGKQTTAALVSGREAARGELFGGTFLSTYMQEYGHNYEDALKKTGDVGTSKIMAATNSGIAAGFELLLPDAKIFDKAMSGLKSNFVPDFTALVKKGGDPKLLIKEGVNAFVRAGKGIAGVGNIISQEVLEEVGTTVVSHVVESIASPQSAAKVNLGEEVWETIKATAIQTFLPALFGGGGAALRTDMNQKQLHDLAINKERTLKELDRAKVEGNITEQEYNTAISLIDTHRKSLHVAPKETANGTRIKREDRLQYAIENTSIAINQEKLNDPNLSLAQKEDLQKKIATAQEVQKEIFTRQSEPASPQTVEAGTQNNGTQAPLDTDVAQSIVAEPAATVPIVPAEGDTVNLDSKLGGQNTYTFTEGDWKYKDSRGAWQKLTPKERTQVEEQFQKENEAAAPTMAVAPDGTITETTTTPTSYKDAHVITKDNLIDLDNVETDNMEAVEAARKVVNAVTQLDPNSKFVIHNTSESFDKAWKEAKGVGTAGGFFNAKDGTIHLDINHKEVSGVTAFHEGAHAIFEYVLSNSESTAKDFHRQLEKTLDRDTLAVLNKFVGRYSKDGKTKSGDPTFTEADEFNTQFFAMVANGDIPLNTTVGQKIKEIIVQLAEKLGFDTDKLGLTSDKNVRDFARKISKAFHDGKALKKAEINNTPVGQVRASLLANNEKELRKLATDNKLSYEDVVQDFYNWVKGGVVRFKNLVKEYARIAVFSLVAFTTPISASVIRVENRSNDAAKVRELVSNYYKENQEDAPQEVIDRAVHLWTMFGSPVIIPDAAFSNDGKMAGDKRAWAQHDERGIVIGDISGFDDFVAELSHAAQYVSGADLNREEYNNEAEYDKIEYDRKGSVEYDAHTLLEPIIAEYIISGKGAMEIIDENFFSKEKKKEAIAAIEKYKIQLATPARKPKPSLVSQAGVSSNSNEKNKNEANKNETGKNKGLETSGSGTKNVEGGKGITKKVNEGTIKEVDLEIVANILNDIGKKSIDEGIEYYEFMFDNDFAVDDDAMADDVMEVYEDNLRYLKQVKAASENENFTAKGGNKLVDEKGNPIVVSRGEAKEFSVFDIKNLGETLKTAWHKAGFFFAPTRDIANGYAMSRGSKIVKDYHLKMDKPFYMNSSEFYGTMDWGSTPKQKYKTQKAAEKAADERLAELKDKGYDGIVVVDDNTREPYEYVPFSTKQIKAVDQPLPDQNQINSNEDVKAKAFQINKNKDNETTTNKKDQQPATKPVQQKAKSNDERLKESALNARKREETKTSLTQLRDAGVLISANNGIISRIKRALGRTVKMSDAEIDAQMKLLDAMAGVWKTTTGNDNFYNTFIAEVKQGNIDEVRRIGGALFQDVSVPVAPRTRVSLAVLQLPQFEKMKGKQVSKQEVENLIKGKGKQIEKDIIQDVFKSDKYKDLKKMSFDEFRNDVEMQIMKLERIFTSTHDDYGMDNLGDENYQYGSARSVIFNSPIEHGYAGDHFPQDFTQEGLNKRSWELRQIPTTTTWAAVDKDMPAGVGEAEIASYVGTAGSKESVQQWIKDRSKKGKSRDINKGMFGHIRTWFNKDTGIFHVAELQSDYFQHHKATELLSAQIPQAEIDEYMNSEIWQPLHERTVGTLIKEFNIEVKEKKGEVQAYKDGVSIDHVVIGDVEWRGIPNEKSARYQVVADAVTKLADRYYKKALNLEGGGVTVSDGYTPVTFSNEQDAQQFIKDSNDKTAEMAQRFRDIKAEYEQERQKLKAKEQEYIHKRTEELRASSKPNLALQQFVASQKVHELRLLREAIALAAEENAETLRFPTPYTLAVIEHYVSDKGDTPYEIIRGDSDRLVAGDIIDYAGETRMIVSADNREIVTAPKDKVSTFSLSQFTQEEISNRISEIEYEAGKHFDDLENITQEEADDYEPDEYMAGTAKAALQRFFAENPDQKTASWKNNISPKLEDKVSEEYWEMSPDDLISWGEVYQDDDGDTVYLVEDGRRAGTENFNQPDQYESGSAKDNFEENLSSGQQTVIDKYKELNTVIRKTRPDATVVEDDNGKEWIETKITEADRINPIIAFQREGAKLKGAVDFTNNNKATAHFFEGADISTLAHEFTGHVGRRFLERLAEGNADFSKDYTAIKKWAGVKAKTWTPRAEEKFARAFENYLRTGKAPTPALKSVFSKLREWMTNIYKTLAGSPIDEKITPEVREIFDRMLGGKAAEAPETPSMVAKASIREEGGEQDYSYINFSLRKTLNGNLSGVFNSEIKRSGIDREYEHALGQAGEALLSVGMPDLSIVTKAGNLLKKNRQGDAPAYLQDLVDKIYTPVAITVSDTDPNTVIIITDTMVGNKPLMIPITVGLDKKYQESLIAKSAYPKDNPAAILDWMKMNNETAEGLLWVDKQKMSKFLLTLRSNSAIAQKLAQATKLVQNFENPTLENPLPLFKRVGTQFPSDGTQGDNRPKASMLPDGQIVETKEIPNAPEIIDGFYSPIEKKIIDTKPNNLSATKWLELFGKKNDETIWTGVKDFLESKKPNDQVTKKEIYDYMSNNRLEIREVVKGEGVFEYSDEQNDEVANEMFGEEYNDLEDYQRDDVDNAISRKEDPSETKYSQYQTEGEKENYREVLITQPSLGSAENIRAERVGGSTTWDVYIGDSEYSTRVLNALTKEQAIKKAKVDNPKFKSSHFDEPNILVHLRMNERTDSDGNKVLFLEEVQSDWGQKGKREGFKTDNPELQARYDALLEKEKKAEGILSKEMRKVFETQPRASIYSAMRDGNKAVTKAYEDFHKVYDERVGLLREVRKNSEGVANAPFVADTNAWTKLGLKHALQHAVNSGAEKLAWTTGEQQNERYDLSRQVDEIQYKKDAEDGTYSFSAIKNNTQVTAGENILEKDLENYFGKEIAQRVIEGVGEKQDEEFDTDGRLGDLKSIKGDNLKVGGKGMKGFYGDPADGKEGIVGSVAKALVKELTGKPAEIIETAIKAEIGDKGWEVLENGEVVWKGSKEINAKRDMLEREQESPQNTYELRERKAKPTVSVQHSIEITPELKAAVQRGMPKASLVEGLSHEATGDTRKFFDLKDYQKYAVTDTELNDEADKLIAKGFDIDALIKRIKRGDQPSAAEIVVAIKFKPLLDIHVFNSPTDANISRVEALVSVMDKLGSDEGLRLRLRRKDVANSFMEGGGEATLADFLVKEKQSKGGKDLTAIEKEKVMREFKEMKALNKQLEAKLKKAQEESAKAGAEAVLKDRKKYGKKKSKTPEQFAAARKEIVDRIREKLKGKNTGNADPNVKSSLVNKKGKPHLMDIAEDVNELFEMLVDENPQTTLPEITDLIYRELAGNVDDFAKVDIHDIIAGVYDGVRNVQTKSDVAKRKVELKKEFEKESELYQEQKNAKRLQELKDRYKKKLEDLKKEEDGAPVYVKPKTPPLVLDKEALDLKDQIVVIEHERNLRLAKQNYANRTRGERYADTALDLLSTPRTIMASFDLSAVLRQGLLGVVTHPIMASHAFVEMIKQMKSPKAFNRWLYDLKQSPEYTLMHQSDLYIADPNESKMHRREEAFMGKLIERVPYFGTWGIRGSERAYIAFLNKLRTDIFKSGAEQLRDAGKTFENSPEEYKSLAKWVNNMTGRGGYTSSVVERASPILSAAFFSPRFMAARLNASGISDILMPLSSVLTTGKVQKGFYASLSPQARRMALGDMAKFILFSGTVVALLKLWADDDDEDEMTMTLNPQSSDFGKIKVGDTRFDMWGGFQQYVTFFGQFLSGVKESPTGKVTDLDKGFSSRLGHIFGFLRKKLSPNFGLAATLLSRSNVIGEKVVYEWDGTADKTIYISDILKSNLLPMLYNDTEDIWAGKNGEVDKAVLYGLAAMFGISIQTYEATPQKSRQER